LTANIGQALAIITSKTQNKFKKN